MNTQHATVFALICVAGFAGAARAQYLGDPGLDPRVAATMDPPIYVDWTCGNTTPPFAARSGPPTLWPDGVVPFVIDASVTNSALTRNAMDTWMYRSGSSPNITFVERDPSDPAQDHYLLIKGVAGGVSSSYIGVSPGSGGTGDGGQLVQQGEQVNVYVMAHEFCHAFGWDHEQCRPDRDSYVTVWYSRVYPADRQHNFDIRAASNWPDHANDTSYDFDSVMHYGATSFMDPGCFGGLADCTSTLNCTPLVACFSCGYGLYQCTMGQQTHLSTSDVQDVLNVYGTRPRPLYYVGFGLGCTLPSLSVGTISFPFCNLTQVPGSGDVRIHGGQTYTVPAGMTFTSPATWKKNGSGTVLITGQ